MADRPMNFDQHMSDSEALMWNLEKDPAMSSWFASITVLDQAPNFEHFRAGLSRGVADIVRLRQRVVPTAGRLSPPEWVIDPDFDLDYHLRRLAVPSPGTERELFDLCTQLLLDPFERTRPLWQFVVIEGLEDGKSAIFQKMHHTITDGEGGVRLAEKFIEFTRDAPMPEMADLTPPDVDSSFVMDLPTAVNHNLRRFGGLAGRAVTNIAKDPVGSATNVAAVVAELRKALVPDTSANAVKVGSPLWKKRTLKRYFGAIRIPFAEAKTASKALGGTINDFFVGGALAGASRYQEEFGGETDALRVAMPVSTRTGGTAGGNSFALTTNDISVASDPLQAFASVQKGLAGAKAGSSVDILGSLAMIINLLPTSVLAKFAKETAGTVDFTVSNVRGAPIEIYMAGAKCLANYAMGPISGTAFNLTTLSYNGSLDMGLVIDAGAVEHPERLCELVEQSYLDLIAAAAPTPPKAKAKAKKVTPRKRAAKPRKATAKGVAAKK